MASVTLNLERLTAATGELLGEISGRPGTSATRRCAAPATTTRA
jgi:hypothetical protein